MTPDTRTRALDAAHRHLTWTAERWLNVTRVAGDDQAAATIAADRDQTGRRSTGSHTDPTGAAATRTLEAHLSGQRTLGGLTAHVTTAAECARWLRSTLTGEPHHGPDVIHAAAADTAWCRDHHAPILSVLSSTSLLLADIDDAIATLASEARVVQGQALVILRGAVQERPTVKQPAPMSCRAHTAAGQTIPATRKGLCDQCSTFRRHHKCDPTPDIIRAWDYGRSRLTPGQIADAQAARRKGSRNATR